jgi:DNA-binding NarL/FixJ family response regulator
MIRLLLADDHALLIEGLKQLFALTSDIEVAGEAHNGAQALELLRSQQFDLLILDMSMPGISGIDLIARIRVHDAKLPILILSMHNELQIARRALKAGANGYLTKDSDPETLLTAVKRTAAGGRFIDSSLAEQMVFNLAPPERQHRHEHLSDREFHILRLLACGMSVNEIAGDLAISNKTVSTHKARLMRKMDFHSNAELVRYALSQGLVD